MQTTPNPSGSGADPRPSATLAHDLKSANQQLVLASLRERELAERTEHASRELERLLRRKTLALEVSSLLSDSLEPRLTLPKVAARLVPQVADACVIELHERGTLVPIASAGALSLPVPSVFRRHTPVCRVGSLAALRSGAPDLRHFSEPPCAALRAELPILDQLAVRSYLSLPLVVRGNVLGLLTLATTCPERQLGPAELDLAEELACSIRTALDNAALYQEACAAARLRDDMLAVVSHDLRSPLSAIGVTARRLRAQLNLDDDSSTARALDLIDRTTAHMQRLVGELLEVARIQTQQLIVHAVPTELGPLLAEAEALLEPLATRKSIRFNVARPERIRVRADGSGIVRALVNLLENALKFTPEGGLVTLSVDTHDGYAQISVRDTGPGIAASDLSKLFEPYWKAERKARSGLGLGLYIARGIVEAHGGKLWADSQLGVGSTFWLSLPLAPTAPETGHTPIRV